MTKQNQTHHNIKYHPVEKLIMCYVCGKIKNRPLVKDGTDYRHDTCIPRRKYG